MFYLDLFQTLAEEQVDYLLIGGLALNIHGVERATMDIDLMLAMDDANLGRFIRVAERLELKPVLPVTLAQLANEAQRRDWTENRNMIAFALRPPQAHAPTVDLLIRTPLDFNAAHARRIDKDIGGRLVSLAAIDDLIAMKSSTGRAHDLADVAALQQLKALGLDKC